VTEDDFYFLLGVAQHGWAKAVAFWDCVVNWHMDALVKGFK